MCSGIRYPHLATEDARPARSSRFPPISRPQSLKVGFPIRKSPDQSLFAAPRSLSQRTTSFIASQRQGIHQMPFSYLIALIINDHRAGLLYPAQKPSNTIVTTPIPVKLGNGDRQQDQFNHTRHVLFRPRCGQTPWEQHRATPPPKVPQRQQDNTATVPAKPLKVQPSNMPSLHDDKVNERTGRPQGPRRPQSRSLKSGCL
jgi:hypothetical protein